MKLPSWNKSHCKNATDKTNLTEHSPQYLAIDRYFAENDLLVNNTEKKPKQYWVTHIPYVSNCKA